MKKFTILLLLSCFAASGFSAEKRDLLQKESEEIGLESALITDFSELGLPTYKDRDFWDKIPDKLREQYILEAEGNLDYDWP
ncbi:MAG: hypothetical protein QNK30_05970, partial [Bacteroidales bacterium]|nr:hypothetical protein [Bacteroidales bacterium]